MNITQEELFCLNFELRSLSEVLIKQESERWLPNFSYQLVEHDHLERYKLASKYVKNKKVLDIACGVGRGSYMLATEGLASSVLGGDINESALRYAIHRNKTQNVSFEKIDAQQTGLKSDIFDIVVSFETIEHLPNYKLFLEEVNRLLVKDGIFIVSTPISHLNVNTSPSNPYHVVEWGFKEFQRILEFHFTLEDVFVQLYPAKKCSTFCSRLVKKILSKINIFQSSKVQIPYISKIEQFTNQYPVEEIGNERIGYQILICKKKIKD